MSSAERTEGLRLKLNAHKPDLFNQASINEGVYENTIQVFAYVNVEHPVLSSPPS